MKLSIVTTLYQSSSFLAEFHCRMTDSVRQLTDDYEIIIVNDGSPDDSLEVALELQRQDRHLVVVDLSRNFGHHKAMMTGLEYARGDYVLMIDTDLEERPELLETYWNIMRQDPRIDVAYGKLEKRKGTLWERWTGWLFYRLLNVLSGEDMPNDIAFSRLMTHAYVTSLLQFREREMYIGGLWHLVGFRQVPVVIRKDSKGISSYTLRKKMEMLLNAITAFSSMPLRMIFYMGLFTTLLSLSMAFYFIALKIMLQEVVSGWTSLIVVILFMSGIIILSIGVVAIYLSKVFIEVKSRPYTIVRKVYSQKEI